MGSIPFSDAASRVNGSKNDDKGTSIGVFLGGGKMGLITVMMAEQMEAYADRPFHENFDQLHGLSVGALNAAMIWPLAETGEPLKTLKELKDGYLEEMDSLFPSNWSSFFGLRSPKFKADNMIELLERTFGELKLSDYADGLNVHVSNLQPHEAVCFSAEEAKQDPSKDFYMRDLLLAATSLPGVFPQNVIQDMNGNERHFTDGGIFSPDPSLLVYLRTPDDIKDNMTMVAFGTGIRAEDGHVKKLTRGLKVAIGTLMQVVRTQRVVAANTMRNILNEKLGDRFVNLDIDISGQKVTVISPMKDILPVAEKAVVVNDQRITKALAAIHEIQPDAPPLDFSERPLPVDPRGLNGVGKDNPDDLRIS